MRQILGTKDPDNDYNIIMCGHGTGVSPPDEEWWAVLVGSVMMDSVSVSTPMASSRRCELDPYFPAVGDQGIQGSCTAWASVYYANTYLQARVHGWTDVKANPAHVMSPAWAYNKVNGGLDGGSWCYKNMLLVSEIGSASMHAMPYNQYDYLSWGGGEAWREAPLYRAGGVGSVSPDNIEVIKSLLNDGYLVTFYIDSSCAWYSSSDLILSYDEYNGAAPCHANVIVGYDDSITDTDAGDSGAFRVANSWGAGFKDGGFYWITYDTMSKIRSNSPVANYYLPRDYGRPYEPLVLGTWTLDPVGTLDGAEVTVGIGSPESPLATTRPSEYWSAGKHSKIPNFMCIDLTEFKGHIDAGADEFFLAMGRGSSAAMITSFSIEIYSAYSDPPIETYSSDEVPAWTPATVAISDRPSVLFSWSPYAPLTFEPVQFTDNSSSKGGTIVSWYWSFGDGVQSGLRSPVHSYSLHGEFIVSLTVTDNNGLSFTRSQTITVQNRIPSVEILSTIGGGYYSGVLELVANASDLDDGIRKVDFFYCVDDQSYFIGSNSSGSATALWRFSWNTSPLTISDVQICAVAFDGYDYSPQSYLPSTINLDNAPPCIPAIRSPRSALRTDAEAIFSWYPAVDAGSGVAKYLIEICGSPDFRSNDLQLMESQEVSCKGALAPGLWYWRVRAIDRAGNMGEWSETRYLIADSFLVNESGFSLSRADIGSSQSVWFKIVYQYDGSPVLGAVVDINGQRAVEIGGGKYAAAVSTLVPYSVVSTSVGVPYFDTVAVEEGVFFVGNTVVYGVLLISCVIAVLYIYRHKGKNAYTTGETKFLLSRPDYALP